MKVLSKLVVALALIVCTCAAPPEPKTDVVEQPADTTHKTTQTKSAGGEMDGAASTKQEVKQKAEAVPSSLADDMPADMAKVFEVLNNPVIKSVMKPMADRMKEKVTVVVLAMKMTEFCFRGES